MQFDRANWNLHNFSNFPEAVIHTLIKRFFWGISENFDKNTCAIAFFNEVPCIKPKNVLKKRLWNS